MHRFRKHLIQNATPQELKVKQALDCLNIPYTFQKEFRSIDAIRFVDFYLREPLALIIEIDGGYHETEEQAAKDKDREDLIHWMYKRVGFCRITNDKVDQLAKNKLLAKFLWTRLRIAVDECRASLYTSDRREGTEWLAEKKLKVLSKKLNKFAKRHFPKPRIEAALI